MGKEVVTVKSRSVDLTNHQPVDVVVQVRTETLTPLCAREIVGERQLQDFSDRTPPVEKGNIVSVKSTTSFPPMAAEGLPLNPRRGDAEIIGLRSDELSSLLQQIKRELLQRSLSERSTNTDTNNSTAVQEMVITAGSSCNAIYTLQFYSENL